VFISRWDRVVVDKVPGALRDQLGTAIGQEAYNLIGRRRALEVLLVADDISVELAGCYGYINRASPDAARVQAGHPALDGD
jgi:hypothetical protein